MTNGTARYFHPPDGLWWVRSAWTHPVCPLCVRWFKPEVRTATGGRNVERCCTCGELCQSGVYVHTRPGSVITPHCPVLLQGLPRHL